MKKFKDIFLYLSAFVPMYILILTKLVVELICNNILFNALYIIYFCTLIILILLGVLGLALNTIYSKVISKEIIILQIKV